MNPMADTATYGLSKGLGVFFLTHQLTGPSVCTQSLPHPLQEDLSIERSNFKKSLKFTRYEFEEKNDIFLVRVPLYQIWRESGKIETLNLMKTLGGVGLSLKFRKFH